MNGFNPKLNKKLVLAAVLYIAGAAWSADCQLPKDAPTGIKAMLTNAFSSHCSGLLSVFKRLASNKKIGGRELEKDKPLDRAAAQQEVDGATTDPKLKAELDQIKATEPDELRRLALEAALFDENLLYAARDLRIEEIRSKL